MWNRSEISRGGNLVEDGEGQIFGKSVEFVKVIILDMVFLPGFPTSLYKYRGITIYKMVLPHFKI